ncbi:MAG TPA: DUF1841 family protein [Gammaproteobacteria bacterium]|nr:DUF1841 family protein [Gammaproteobacteria bacterium]
MNINDTRETYFKAWRKHQLNEKLEPLEKQLLHLIQEHPEYHDVFANPEKFSDYNFSAENNEENPFLHLGLHLTLLEQVSTNRPKGITAVYKEIVNTMGDVHHAEHHIMDILARELWQMMDKQKQPDKKNYLKQLKKLLKRGCAH